MRYIIRFFYKDIIGAFLFKEQLCVYSDNNLNFYNEKFEIKEILQLDTYNNFKIINDTICCSNPKNLYLIKNYKLIKSKESLSVFDFYDDSIFCVKKEKDSFVCLALNDDFKETNFIKTNSSYPIKIALNNTISIQKNKKLFCYSYIDNNLLWQYNVEDYFNAPSKILEGRVLVIEDRLVFFAHTEDWNKAATFVLDANTGEVLFTSDQMGLKLYKYNKHIYQIQENKIKKINPITTEIQTINLTEELAKRKIILEDKSACFYNNKLYTLAREENNDIYSIWVVINLDNGTIEYQYEMLFEPDKKATDKNKMFITDIQANDKMVAVLGGNNLHIFEKEEIAS